MNANLWLVLGTAVLFGLSTGLYEFVLPLFLKAQGISFGAMGVMFAVAGAVMLLARIYMGGLADHWGRKPLYGLALGVCGLASGMVPVLPGFATQLALKMIRDTAALTRETLFPILLYEEQRGIAFLNFIGKFRGIEYLLQAGGTVLAGMILLRMGGNAGYETALYAAGGVMLLGAGWWWASFREHARPAAQRIMSLRDLFNFDLHANLRVILVSSVIFTFGVQLSHSFYLPLFFIERFQAPDEVVALIMVLHRLTIALPMLVVGNLPIRNLRAWYIAGFLLEGVTMGASAVLTPLTLSAAIFLLHDLIGAGIWVPIQAMLIQRYSRDATRGIEVGKVLAWGSLGSIAGPLAAGHLAMMNPVLPFLLSGILMGLAAVPLFWLNPRAPEPDEAVPVEVGA